MDLKIGQQFRVRSNIAQRFEDELGPFYFIVEITSLATEHETPTVKEPWRDLSFKLIHYAPRDRDRYWYACHCLSLGHSRYGPPEMNYSPDFIAGEGEWCAPDLFRWQHMFLYLVLNKAVEYIGWKDPARYKEHPYEWRRGTVL